MHDHRSRVADGYILVTPVPGGWRWVECVEEGKVPAAAHQRLIDGADFILSLELIDLFIPGILDIPDGNFDGFDLHRVISAAEKNLLTALLVGQSQRGNRCFPQVRHAEDIKTPQDLSKHRIPQGHTISPEDYRVRHLPGLLITHHTKRYFYTTDKG